MHTCTGIKHRGNTRSFSLDRMREPANYLQEKVYPFICSLVLILFLSFETSMKRKETFDKHFLYDDVCSPCDVC